MRVITKIGIGALLLLAQGMVSAAGVAVCTAPGGCGPDFAINVDLVDYDYSVGSNTGILSITGTVGNSTFLPGQLHASWSHSSSSIPVAAYAGPPSLATSSANDDFFLTFTVDGSGNLISGANNVTMNGAVMQVVAPFPTADIAKSFNGTVLDGGLIAGGTINQIDWSGSVLEFEGSIDGGSILTTAGYGNYLGGILSLGSSVPNIVWNADWSSSSGTLDVVVPVPAAFWLFLSGLTALVSVKRNK